MCTEQTCGSCKHFRRHYVRQARGRYLPLIYGHCVKPRLKNREADTRACPHWQEREPDPR